MMLSNKVNHVLQLCTDACFNGNAKTRKQSTALPSARRTRPWPRESRTWRSALSACRIVYMPTEATFSTSFDSIIHPMDQGKSTFNYMSIGWLFRKIFRKNGAYGE